MRSFDLDESTEQENRAALALLERHRRERAEAAALYALIAALLLVAWLSS